MTADATPPAGPTPSGVLGRILETTRAAVRHLRAPDPATLEPSTRDFAAALRTGRRRVAIIAEAKKASPSAGLLCPDFRPADIARDYAAGGAAALSVVTDGPWFQGWLGALTEARAAVSLPVLRKDFIVDERQIHEARGAGADAVLLIAAALDTETLGRFRREAAALGMAALVEIHDAAELERAVDSGATIVGINNRNLHDFRIDTGLTLRLAPGLPPEVLVVSESGIESEDDLRRLAGVADAALVGTSLMTAPDRVTRLRNFVAATGG